MGDGWGLPISNWHGPPSEQLADNPLQHFNHAVGRPLATQALWLGTGHTLWSAIGGAGSFKFGMTESQIPGVLMQKCIACEQLLCTFARRELIGKLMGM